MKNNLNIFINSIQFFLVCDWEAWETEGGRREVYRLSFIGCRLIQFGGGCWVSADPPTPWHTNRDTHILRATKSFYKHILIVMVTSLKTDGSIWGQCHFSTFRFTGLAFSCPEEKTPPEHSTSESHLPLQQVQRDIHRHTRICRHCRCLAVGWHVTVYAYISKTEAL